MIRKVLLATFMYFAVFGTILGCTAFDAFWNKEVPVVKRDLVLDEKDIPCLVDQGLMGASPLSAMTNCHVPQDLYQLVVDMWNARGVPVGDAGVMYFHFDGGFNAPRR